MPTALDISGRFIREVILPLLGRHHPDLVDRIAVGVHGTGSDVLGLDDQISRDHHWGPRAAVLLQDADSSSIERVRETLAAHSPPVFDGHPIHHDRANRTAVCVDHISGYLRWFLGTTALPQRDEDWFGLCETDLLHLTSGEVFHDPSGVWSGVRTQLSYYPDRVWRKRVADWCMYVTGRDAPYNLHRLSRRGDAVASQIYFGQALRRTMELGFAIECRYSPYPKWQYRLFRTIGGCAPRVLPLLDALVAESSVPMNSPPYQGGVGGGPKGEHSAIGNQHSAQSPPSQVADSPWRGGARGGLKGEDATRVGWKARIDLLIQINHIYAHRLHEFGLTGFPSIQPFDEGLTDLTLYASAKQIYDTLPPAWRELSFSQIESWEKMARLVLFDSGDYFQTKFGQS